MPVSFPAARASAERGSDAADGAVRSQEASRALNGAALVQHMFSRAVGMDDRARQPTQSPLLSLCHTYRVSRFPVL